MTDIEKLAALLDEWDVPYYRGPINDYKGQNDGTLHVEVGAGPGCPLVETKKITGYCGFFIDFEFDAEGQFVKMGAWE